MESLLVSCLLFFVVFTNSQQDYDAEEMAGLAGFVQDAVTYSAAHPEDAQAAQWAAHLKALQADPVKRAALFTLTVGCGTLSPREIERLAKQGKVYGKILTDAGPTVVPALVFLVSDKECNCDFVGEAAAYAAQYPRSEPLLAALRVRRGDKGFDDNLFWYLGLFKYFALYGDHDDLIWMEATAARMSHGDPPPEVLELIQTTKARLHAVGASRR